MREQISLELEPRSMLGKKVRRLRREGVTPVHLYGLQKEPLALQCASATLQKVVAEAGRNAPVFVTVRGDSEGQLAFIREIQREPLKGAVLHVDLLRVEMAQRVTAEVPLVLSGESLGARLVGGSVVQALYSVQVEALPLDIPRELEVDLSVMSEPDSVLRSGDLELPANVSLITAADTLVARVEAARVEEVAPKEEEEGAAEEPTGEAAEEPSA